MSVGMSHCLVAGPLPGSIPVPAPRHSDPVHLFNAEPKNKQYPCCLAAQPLSSWKGSWPLPSSAAYYCSAEPQQHREQSCRPSPRPSCSSPTSGAMQGESLWLVFVVQYYYVDDTLLLGDPRWLLYTQQNASFGSCSFMSRLSRGQLVPLPHMCRLQRRAVAIHVWIYGSVYLLRPAAMTEWLLFAAGYISTSS